jgi:AcrR family transcriptional regulator
MRNFVFSRPAGRFNFNNTPWGLALMDTAAANFKHRDMTKRRAIGRAAAKLFDEKGYLETSLKDISTAAKLSKGGIYHYFASKHEILYFVLDGYMDLLLEGLEDQLKGISENGSKIQFILFRHLKCYIENSPEARALLIDSRNLPSEYFKVIAQKEKKYAHIATTVLSDYFHGSISKDRIKAMSYTMFGICNAIMYWYDPEGPITIEELSRISYDIFMNGINSFDQAPSDAQNTSGKEDSRGRSSQDTNRPTRESGVCVPKASDDKRKATRGPKHS